ncbi:hypothetical protein [Pseudomonas sp. A-B-19]|uniref:hypothetical protein n=1 Tax=Pseudomonas sp. A-B-19 TaxID=2832405 RepID=UPI001CBF1BF5|nr:hypothetical protein [Pseudomonas sp. A-B-19]
MNQPVEQLRIRLACAFRWAARLRVLGANLGCGELAGLIDCDQLTLEIIKCRSAL